jgi:putative transposase
MPDHMHLIATVPAETRLAQMVTQWKRYVARESGVDWQRDFFEHRLRRDEHFDAKLDYLRMNPVRAGLVTKPEEWPFFWTW